MTDENQQGPTPNPADAADAAEAAALSPPSKPFEEAGYAETHTAQNTPMKKLLPTEPSLLRVGTEEDRETGYLPIFLGNTKEANKAATELMGKWLQLTAMKSLFKDGQANDGMLASTKAEWAQFIETRFPSKTLEEMEDIASNLYRYKEEFEDSIKVRSSVMNEDGISNVTNRGSNVRSGEIMGKKPGASSKGFTISELMRRSSMRASSGEFQFDVLLRDSYTAITFVRMTKLELGGLINDINRTVKGYVRQVGGNNITLAYIAGVRAVWEFLAPRIVNSSVTGIADFADLARVIRLSDFGTICMALIKATHNAGINLDLRCLTDLCDWHEFQITDPDKLVRVRHSIISDEDEAIYANIFNGNVKYSVEDTLKMINASTYGLDSNKVYNEDKTVFFTMAPPSLAEAMETFDYYAGRINPKLQELRSKIVDKKEYEHQVGLLLTTLGATEYLHWISTYTALGEAGTEESGVVLHRFDCDAGEFNKGVMDVILDSPALNKGLMAFVLNKTPKMSRTFVAVANFHCPKCRARIEGHANPERKLGYTPIDPYMAFFTLTQLKMMRDATEAAEATHAAISE